MNTFYKKRGQAGFTLVEIMIVVAIIGLLSAIAIPNLLRARMNANESAIKGDLRTFSSAIESFRAAQNPPAFPVTVSAMTSATPPYLDDGWENGPIFEKHGYTVEYSAVGGDTYSIDAFPTSAGQTGQNYYCIDHRGFLLYATSEFTDADSTGCVEGTNGGIPVA